MSAKHTPTPWKLGYQDNQCIYSDYKCVAVVQCKEKEWQANADFIVRAVNSHEELVKALKDLTDWIDNYGSGKNPIDLTGAMVNAKQAIAKAEGR